MNARLYSQHSFKIVARPSSLGPAATNFFAPLDRINRSPGCLLRVNQTEAHQSPTPLSETEETPGQRSRNCISAYLEFSTRQKKSIRFSITPLLARNCVLQQNKVLFRRSDRLDLNESFQSTFSTFDNLIAIIDSHNKTARQPFQGQITGSSLLHNLLSGWRNLSELRSSAQPSR